WYRRVAPFCEQAVGVVSGKCVLRRACDAARQYQF
ncbi:hypothetical protein A2U01_0114247, partial [Trifolium medium]|nr:hypothetical protein [Trifolium medium]